MCFFFFNDSTTAAIYTLSLHDALPIYRACNDPTAATSPASQPGARPPCGDRKSTRLNSSHLGISYAVFCLKKKKNAFEHKTQLTSIRLKWVPASDGTNIRLFHLRVTHA